jgi:hypothetical protein
MYSYEIESQPPGIISTTSGSVSPGTPVWTPNISYGQTSGYYFGYWTINGVRQAGLTEASLTEVRLAMTNDEAAVAVFFPPGDSTGSGLPDWYQWFWFGATNQTSSSDSTGDGFALSSDLVDGYSPVVANVTTNGGEIMRLSPVETFVGGPPQYYYQIESQPEGIIPTTSGYVAPGTPVLTPNISYGQTSGYYFGYWTINGVRQAGLTRASLTEVQLAMTNDEVAVAVFFPPGDSTGSGLPDWYQWFWFGAANQTSSSDSTGDGFALSSDLADGYSPVIANVTTNGGEIMRLSPPETFVGTPPQTTMQLVSTNALSGTAVTVQLSIAAQGVENALGFSIQYDTNLLSFVGASVAGGAEGGLLLVNTNLPGEVGIALALPPGVTLLAGTQNIVQLTFAVMPVANPAVATLSFVNQPIGQEVIGGGVQALLAVFQGGSVQIQTAPSITWPTPSSIVYGTPLGGTQLDATASAPGTFSYNPPANAILNAGSNQALSVTFMPSNSTLYVSVTNSVTINVLPAVPLITWVEPTNIIYGTPLGSHQLDATSVVTGTFSFQPGAGTILNVGSGQVLSVNFTPNDQNNYLVATATTGLTVQPAGLVVTAANASRFYGQTNPVFSGTIIGIENNDNLSASFSCIATPTSPPRTYPIVPMLLDPNNRRSNYVVMLVQGLLTVNPGPAPVIGALLPNFGLTNGGTAVTVQGSGFENGATVWFGANPAVVTFNSSSNLSVITPPGNRGPVNVVATNADGQASVGSQVFNYSGLTTFQIESTNGEAGGTVVVPVAVLAQGGEFGLQFSVGFDTNLLTYLGATTGANDPFATLVQNTNSATSGQVGLTLTLPTGSALMAGTQQVAALTFAVVPVRFVTNTIVAFGDQPTARQAIDTNSLGLVVTSESGTVTIFYGFEGDVSPRPYGNGEADIADWVQVGRFVAGIDTTSSLSEFQRADCAPRSTLGDGLLTLADWVQAGRYAAALDPLTPAGGPTGPLESSDVVSLPSAATPNVASGGARSLAELANSSSSAQADDSPAATRTISLTKGVGAAGETTNVEVQLTALGNENAVAFTFSWPTAAAIFEGATLGADAQGCLLILNTNQTATGALGVMIGSSAGQAFAQGTRTLLNINLQTKLPTTAQVAASFTDMVVRREVVDAQANTLTAEFLNGMITISPPKLVVQNQQGNLILQWSGSGILQSASSPGGPYSDLPDAKSPFSIAPTAAQMYFRVRFPQ